MIEGRTATKTDVATKLSRQSAVGDQTKVSCYAPAALAARHHFTAGLAASLAGINALTGALVAS